MKPEEALADAGSIKLDLSKNKTQRDFFMDTRPYLCYSGGFGSGKTTICCAKGMLLSAMIPNNMGVVVRQTYPDLRDTTRKVFIELVPPDWIKYWREAENALTLKNGSLVLFRHFENDRIKVGANLGWFFIDQAEEANKEIFLGLQGRLRRYVPRRYGMLAMNPNGKDWQYKMFCEDAKPDYGFYCSTTYDNQANLPDGYIQTMLENYPQDWIDRFVYGKWSSMSGLIFHEFDRRRHVIKPFQIPRDWPKGRGMDWGVDSLTTCTHVAVGPDGRRYVYATYGNKEMTPEEHAKLIISQSRPFGAYRATVLDSSAFHREKDLKSVADQFVQAGLKPIMPATRDLLARIWYVKNMLKNDQLFFFDGVCNPLLDELEAWKWGAPRAGREVPARGNDHYLDGLGYILYWLYRKMLYSPREEAARAGGRRYAENARLMVPSNTSSQADAVTGLPN